VSTFSWQLPPPPISSGAGATGSSVASTTAELLGLLDLAFDPLTHDLVDAADGAWVETTDSRTAVIFQMESELDTWWGDPTQGSRIAEIITGEDPGTIRDLVDEVKRCLQPLVAEGVISDLQVTLDTDFGGRPVILMLYRDRSTGHPIDLAYVPFNA
jgi:hypothetical protein